MDNLTRAMNYLLKTLSRYREKKFTGQITVVFNLSQGHVGDMEFGAKHKFKP